MLFNINILIILSISGTTKTKLSGNTYPTLNDNFIFQNAFQSSMMLHSNAQRFNYVLIKVGETPRVIQLMC